MNHGIEEGVEGSHRGRDAEVSDQEEGPESALGAIGEAVVADDGDEEVLAGADAGAAEVGEEGLHGGEGACAGEPFDHGLVGLEVVGEIGVEVPGVVKDLEGEVEVLLAAEHGGEALGGEADWPGLDGWGDGVGFEEVLFGMDGGERRVGWGGDAIDGCGVEAGDPREGFGDWGPRFEVVTQEHG